jgi:(1->4)-alpha-D-glucan 1-alpha-D-glucosylmutase
VLHFPVYRTYLTANGIAESDRALIGETIEKARADWFGADEGLFDFLRDALTMDLVAHSRGTASKPRLRRFALKVQQFTGPTMAKSLEDTAFYRYHRLLALNEVGGEPAAGAMPIADFHERMQRRLAETPHGLTATATHDTKRGEDARARILALAELPGEWASLVGRWKLMNAAQVATNGEVRSPSTAFEYMLYQALVGAWPLEEDPDFVARMQGFALKAAREGKQETSWLNPNESYEKGVEAFLAAILDPERSAEFLDSIGPFAERLALLGALNSLSQLTLKATMPGVPDFYQGTEGWDLSLVDPDNRRPVDYERRQTLLAEVAQPDWPALSQSWRSGEIKMALTRKLLALRSDYRDVFTDGGYRPIEVDGPHADSVIAFVRHAGGKAVLVAVAKRFLDATGNGRQWPQGSFWQGALKIEGLSGEGLSGDRLALSEAFANLPVAFMPVRTRQ